MINLKIKNNRIKDIQFEKPISQSRWLNNLEERQHLSLSKRFNFEKYEFASVIILKDRLDPSLMTNPKYCKMESFIGVSKIQEEARKRMVNKYYDEESVEKIISDQEYQTKQFNFKKDSLRPSFLSKLKDSIYESQELELIPEIFQEYCDSAKFDYDDSLSEEIERNEDDTKLAIDILRKELFLPQVFTTYNRVYALPEPFDFWDDRNLFQQYYLVSNGESIDTVQGGPASSHQREMHGLWAHTFAELSKTKKIRTWVLKYNSKNELILVDHFDQFKAMNYDLTGNYAEDWSVTKVLFKGKLLKSSFSEENGSQKIQSDDISLNSEELSIQ